MAKSKSIAQQRLAALESFRNNLNSSNNANNMDKSISNYKTRLNSVGKNPEEETDKRNWFEKITNLPQDQNALFDFFEIINRPQQALFSGIEAAQTGDNILDSALEGLKGENETNFGNILRNAGVSDDALFVNPITKEDTSLADVLGLVGDIVLDPVDLPIAGKGKSILEATMGTAVKGTKNIAGKAITKGAEALDVNTVSKLAKEAGLIKKGTKVTSDMIPTLTKQLADNGIEFASKSDALKQLGKSFSRTIDYSKSMPDDLYSTITRSDNALDAVNAYGKKYASDLRKQVDDYAKLTGKNADEISSGIQTLISSKYAPEISVADSIKDIIKDGKKSIKGNRVELEALKKSIDDFKVANNITDNVLNVSLKGNSLKMTGNKKLLGNVLGTEDLVNKLSDIKYAKRMTLDDNTLKIIDDLDNVYKNDDVFKSLVDTAESGYTNFNDFIKNVTGETVNFEDMLREGYVTNALTDEGKQFLNTLKDNNIGVSQKAMAANKSQYYTDMLEGNKNVAAGKTYDNVAEQANKQFANDIQNSISSKQKEIERLTADIHSNKVKSLEKELANNKIDQTTALKNYEENISKANISKNKAIKLKQGYNNKIDDISNIIDKKVMDKAKKINDYNLVGALESKSKNYVNKSNKVTEIQAALSKKGLDEKQIKKLTDKLEKAVESRNIARNELEVAAAKIKGAASEKYIKNAGKLANDMSDKAGDLTKKAIKAQDKIDSSLSKIKQYEESYTNIAKQLEKQQADLKLQLNNLKNMTPDQIAKNNEFITDRISSLQKDIDLLSSFEGKKLFSTDFFEGFDTYINKTTNQAKAMKNYHEALLHSGLSNTEAVRFVEKGSKVDNIPGMVKLDTAKVNSYLDGMKNFMPKDSELIKEFKQLTKNSKAVYVEEGINELLTINSKMNKNEANIILKTIDDTSNLFKKTSTFTPGFHLRNITGNASNMWLSGMSATDIAKSYKDAARLSKSDYMIDLITKNANGTLTAAEKADYKIIDQFIQSGALGKGKDIRDLGDLIEKASTNKESKNILKKAWDGAFNLSAKGNEKMDNLSRMALLSHASKNEKYVAKLGAKDAIGAMKQVLFDPQNLSPFEKKYLKRVIPFYTFTKQNLMFQMKNVVNNTTRYNRLVKAYNKMYEGVGENNYRQYQKENFEIPVVGDEGTTSIKTNLPLGDLGEYASNPLQRLVSSTNPLIKTPFEMVTGVDTFTGQDVSNRSPLDVMLDTTGLSNLTTKQIDKFNNIKGGNMTSDNALATLAPSIFRYTDPTKVANQRQYEELMQYQQIIKNLKNKGVKVPTMQDLKAYNKLETSDKSYDKLTPNQKETLKEYNKYIEYVQSLKAQGIDVPTIRELTSNTNNSLRNVQRTRNKKRRS